MAKVLGDKCLIYESMDLWNRNFFGLYEPHPRLFERIGDFIIIPKEEYIIKDFLMGEKEKYHIGNHGGLSSQEMYVPLIVITASK